MNKSMALSSECDTFERRTNNGATYLPVGTVPSQKETKTVAELVYQRIEAGVYSYDPLGLPLYVV